MEQRDFIKRITTKKRLQMEFYENRPKFKLDTFYLDDAIRTAKVLFEVELDKENKIKLNQINDRYYICDGSNKNPEIDHPSLNLELRVSRVRANKLDMAFDYEVSVVTEDSVVYLADTAVDYNPLEASFLVELRPIIVKLNEMLMKVIAFDERIKCFPLNKDLTLSSKFQDCFIKIEELEGDTLFTLSEGEQTVRSYFEFGKYNKDFGTTMQDSYIEYSITNYTKYGFVRRVANLYYKIDTNLYYVKQLYFEDVIEDVSSSTRIELCKFKSVLDCREDEFKVLIASLNKGELLERFNSQP